MNRKPLPPGATIGLLGGGQLAQMLVHAGNAMGFRFVALDPNPECPAFYAGAEVLAAPYGDRAALAELAKRCDLVTYEFENVEVSGVEFLESRVLVPQGSRLLALSQHRIREKIILQEQGFPVTPFRIVRSVAELSVAHEALGPLMLKTVTGGYDGKGQQKITSAAAVESGFAELSRKTRPPFIAEELVEFERELSVVVARNPAGEIASFPVGENVHEKNILTLTRVPARINPLVEAQALRLAEQVAEVLSLVGVLGLELFLLPDNTLLVNELAPRPHNSGHYTQDACATSQFEQHLRAVAAWPLGATTLHTPVVMLNLIGEQLSGMLEQLDRLPAAAHLHLYHKHEVRAGRKLGHLNFTCDDPARLLETLNSYGIWTPSLLENALS